MYHIAVFVTSENLEEVEIIHEKWILPGRSFYYYPPFLRTQLHKALKNGMEPGSAWPKYKIRILHTYGNLLFYFKITLILYLFFGNGVGIIF